MNTLLSVFVFLVPIFLLLTKRISSSKKLPPGSLGIPIIGQSLSLLQNMRGYKNIGPISKMCLFGKPTVFLYGQAANKFAFASDSSILANSQTESVKTILDHKRVRDALMSFLKPESLKQYVGKMDLEVRLHIDEYWQCKKEVTVLPLMKTLTFNIICTLLFGIERGARRDKLVDLFQEMIAGMWSIPINLPFTRYTRSIHSSKSVRNMLKDLIGEKGKELQEMGSNPHQDLITCMLSSRNPNDVEEISEEEIVDNSMLVMTAGHDTSAVVLTFLIRLLAKILLIALRYWVAEQEEIAKGKHRGESLIWEDITKMKYTWRVAMETMRMFPPIFGGFSQAVKDIENDGYIIPKLWQIFWVTSMTQMDDGIFREPQKFDPARFENPSSIPPYCYIPFGGGPRICPGSEFAKIETLVTIHYLVTQFTWKLSSDDCFSRDPMPASTKGLPIQIAPKKQMF
ncbi:hypothetical protein P3X46_027174 [Hevea brasiliensis]|uniref:Cytochrome P450 n=1 Tax=Hevea brasiliensis TaxID=3981 RepID=A0ABQ9L031_HEVBR|nr:hypothetical protein P3X46_027174 [Hevea brasiliensis]